MVSTERNALKFKYREMSPLDEVARFDARNIDKYGNSLGPTVEQLRAPGKAWEQIIEPASRSESKDLGL